MLPPLLSLVFVLAPRASVDVQLTPRRDKTAMIRDEKKAAGFNDIGVKTVIGDFKSLDLITKECAKADMVISIGDCDDVASVGAMLAGLKESKKKTGMAKPFFHTVSSASKPLTCRTFLL